MPAERPRKKTRWIKGIVLAVVGVVVVLFMLLAATPMLISAGLGHGFIRGTIEKQINGTVTFEKIKLSWLGTQSVKGLKVSDAQGRPVADVNVRLASGLFALLRGTQGALAVDLDGDLRGEVREDGSLSFTDLIKPAPPDAPKRTRRPGEPPQIALGPANLRINGLRVTLEDTVEHQIYTLQDLTGVFAFVPGGTSNARLAGGIKFGSDLGSIDIDVVTDGLFDPRGVLYVDGAVVRSSVKLRNVPVPRHGDQIKRVNVLDLDLVTDNLARRLDLTARLETLLPSGEVSVLESTLAATEPISRMGKPTVSVERVTGSVTGTDVPTALLKPVLAKTPISPVRDFGPTLDIEARFSEGAEKEVMLDVTGANVSVALAGVVNARDKTVVGNKLDVRALVQPELVAAVSPYHLRQATPVVVSVAYFTIPPLDDDGTLPLDRIRAAGSIFLEEPTALTMGASGTPMADVGHFEMQFAPETADPGAPVDRWAGSVTLESTVYPDPLRELAQLPADQPTGLAVEITDLVVPSPLTGRPFRLETVELRGNVTVDGPLRLTDLEGLGDDGTLQFARLQIEAPALADGVRLQGSAGVAGGTLTFDERVDGFLDPDGQFDPQQIMAVGLVELRGVKPDTLARLLPEQAELIRAGTRGNVSVRVITERSNRGPLARVFLFGGGLEVSATATRRDDGLSVTDGRATVSLAPALVAALQSGSEAPIVLKNAPNLTVEVDPLLLPGEPPFTYRLGRPTVTARITADHLLLEQVPSLAAAIDLRDIRATVEAQLTDVPVFQVDLATDLIDPPRNEIVARITGDVTVRRRGEEYRPAGEVVVSALDVAGAERLLGLEPGTATDWLGPGGRVTARLVENAASYEATLTADLPQVKGSLTGTLVGEQVSVKADDFRVTLRRDVLQQKLNPVEPGAPAAPPRLSVGDHVPVRLSIDTLRLPRALLMGEPFDPTQAEIRVKLTSDAIHLADADGTRSSLRDLSLAILSSNLRAGVEGKLLGTADVSVNRAGEAAAGKDLRINVSSKVTQLVGTDSKLHPEQAKLELTAILPETPTAIADTLLNLQGLLVAAVGPSMNATFTARDFSADSGTLDARIDTTNGWLEAHVTGKDNALHLDASAPLQAQLKIEKPLRDRVLKNVHPLFADIRSALEPVRLTLGNALVPADGDLSRLNADLELTVGDVQIDKSSLMLLLLAVTQRSPRDTIDANIPPIRATIRKGILSYERFEVQFERFPPDSRRTGFRYSMSYVGTIDLVKKTIDLRTEIPLSALAKQVKELEGQGDKIMVPIVTRGTFDKYKTEIDPKFDLVGAAAKAGIEKAIQDALKKKAGDPVGDILGDIFGPPKP